MADQMTLTEAAHKIAEAGENWIGHAAGHSLDEVLLATASALSDDPNFNLAAFLRFNDPEGLKGESDIEVIQTAILINKIVNAKAH